VVTRIAFRTAVRAAAVTLLDDFKADVGMVLQTYPARPRSVNPPTAFVDSIRESFEYPGGVRWRERTTSVEIVVLWGLFDSKEATDQADAFCDAFLDWVTDRYHAAGANTIVEISNIEDEPTYVPDWMQPSEQRTYFATRITLEGFAGG
jgi:hypothetical protein